MIENIENSNLEAIIADTRSSDEIMWITPYAFRSPGKNVAVNKAFLEFQSELVAITKDSSNPFGGYTYASLDAIMSDILPRLSRAGLILTQAIGKDQITTTVTHAESGQFFGELTPIVVEASRPKMSPAQLYGTGVTYCRRYALGLLGITTSVDDDASGETTEKIKREATISKDVANQLIAEIKALGYDEAYLNAAVVKAIGAGRTVYDIPMDRLDNVKKWISMQKKQNTKSADEEVV